MNAALLPSFHRASLSTYSMSGVGWRLRSQRGSGRCGPCHEGDVLAAMRTDNGAPYLVWRFREGFLEEVEFQMGPEG